jgi:hypothetical protein
VISGDVIDPTGFLIPIIINAGEGEHFVAADGSPVWPLHDADDVATIERIAEVLGGRLSWVPASPGTSLPLSSEFVVALGTDAGIAARLYAHLTRRHCLIAEDLNGLMGIGRPSVVVTTPTQLTAELLDWLYARTRKLAPGVVCGDASAPLLRQVLVRAAAATFSGPLRIDRTEIYPTLPGSSISRILGSEATVTERRRALADGAGVLTVMTHSDGVDAFLGAGLSVCARNRDSSDLRLAGAPRCGLTAFCHRHEMPVDQALGSGTIFASDEIAARVLVWDVCFGVMPSGSVVDPPWGIGTRLLASAGIGAVLTTWQITLSNPAYAHQVTDAIAGGMTVGAVVADFNASREARDHHHRMCLLGDPRVRLPCRDPCVRVTPRAGAARPYAKLPPPPKAPNEIPQAALLRLCMLDAKKNAPEGTRARLAAMALDAIKAFEVVVTKGVSITDIDPGLGNNMRLAVLKYALARGKLLENWIPHALSLRAAAPTLCPVCRRLADALYVKMRMPGVTGRCLIFCPICGVLEDVPATTKIGFELDGRTLRLHGMLPLERWMAAVLIGSSYPADSVKLMWPSRDDGAPASILELPPTWPPGPLRLSVFIMWDTNFAIISRMVRDSG